LNQGGRAPLQAPAASTVADADEPTTTPRAHDIPPQPLILLAEKGLENQSLLSKEKTVGKSWLFFQQTEQFSCLGIFLPLSLAWLALVSVWCALLFLAMATDRSFTSHSMHASKMSIWYSFCEVM
jgi:hypothetical protein